MTEDLQELLCKDSAIHKYVIDIVHHRPETLDGERKHCGSINLPENFIHDRDAIKELKTLRAKYNLGERYILTLRARNDCTAYVAKIYKDEYIKEKVGDDFGVVLVHSTKKYIY